MLNLLMIKKETIDKARFLLPILMLSALNIQWAEHSNFGFRRINTIKVTVDSVDINLYQATNDQGFPLYYYREVDQYPCNDKICYKMELRVFWDIWGNFLKIETEEGKDLTKIGHEAFSEKDYTRLHKQLNNPKSGIQYYKLKDLTEEDAEDEYYSIDAIAGATIEAKDITYESVKGAVKTCFTLWHIVHGETSEIIESKTREQIKTIHNDSPDTLISNFITLDNFQQTKILQSLVNSGHNPDIDFFENAIDNLNTKNTQYTLFLIELMRYNNSIKNKQLKLLTEKIKNDHSNGEIAIYNYLLQMDFNDKLVRKYALYE